MIFEDISALIMAGVNLAYFISSRLNLDSNNGFTSIIIKIAIGTIALSVAVMITSTAVMKGFKSQITEKIFGFWGHIHITDANINRTFELYPIQDSKDLRDSINNIKKLTYYVKDQSNEQRTLGGVKKIQSFIIFPAIIKTKTNFEGIILKGVYEDYNWDDMREKVKLGEILEFEGTEPSRDILLSEQTAQRLNLKVGDPLIINFVKDRNQIKRRFGIKGIYRTGLEEYDKKIAFIDQRILRDILKWEEDEIGGYEIILDDFEDANVIADYIYEELLPSNQYAETIKEKFPSIFEWLELQNINEKIIIILMILVSLINMATALLILILERTKMIGILKALGETNWNIRKIFLYNAGNIVLYGLIIGNALGLGFCFLQQKFQFIKLDEANYYLSSAPIEFDFWSIIFINLGTIFAIMLFLIVPSYLVTKINTIKVLRFA